MKIAIVGSRNLTVDNIEKYVSECDELVSGGAIGVDFCVSEYARKNNVKLTEFLPEYTRYGKAAPILRNRQIVNYADKIIVFWNGSSKGTLSVINYAKKIGKDIEVIILKQP